MARAEEYIAELSVLDPERVESALEGLAGLGEGCIATILKRLVKEGDSGTRINLMRALGRVSFANSYYDPAALDELRRLRREGVICDCRGDGAAGLHELATYVKVLGMMGEPGCLDEITAEFANADDRIRANAVEGAAFIVTRWKFSGGLDLQRSLEELAGDGSVRVSVNATVALYLVHSTAVERLRSRVNDLCHSKDPAVRTAAEKAAAAFGLKTGGLLDFFGLDSIFALVGSDIQGSA